MYFLKGKTNNNKKKTALPYGDVCYICMHGLHDGLGCAQLRARPTVVKSVLPGVSRTPMTKSTKYLNYLVRQGEQVDAIPIDVLVLKTKKKNAMY
jgi:hypothetical protein